MNKDYQPNWKIISVGVSILMVAGILMKFGVQVPIFMIGIGISISSFGATYGLARFIDDIYANPQRYLNSYNNHNDVPENITHTHNHYIHGEWPRFTEGVEHVEIKPDGTRTSVRYVKKYD